MTHHGLHVGLLDVIQAAHHLLHGFHLGRIHFTSLMRRFRAGRSQLHLFCRGMYVAAALLCKRRKQGAIALRP